ncbi:hypothetical protein [Phaeocystidibacter luteus]|uniref:Uncharacterized protein n=1 Tax=Phaeocystidibacter luteus TaxID=911197 RepID=A0A6N6RLV5_9FLAO|nr:hypothetical protein [Phaeocystidibacter luteus]KAB2814548.1 hypothetical protein F8C67_02075 [Phaeocystidibacter luteus]
MERGCAMIKRIQEILSMKGSLEEVATARMKFILEPVASEIASETFETEPVSEVLWQMITESIVKNEEVGSDDKEAMIRLLAPYRDALRRCSQMLLAEEVMRFQKQ